MSCIARRSLALRPIKTPQPLAPGFVLATGFRVSLHQREIDFKVVGIKLQRRLQMLQAFGCVPGLNQRPSQNKLRSR